MGKGYFVIMRLHFHTYPGSYLYMYSTYAPVVFMVLGFFTNGVFNMHMVYILKSLHRFISQPAIKEAQSTILLDPTF